MFVVVYVCHFQRQKYSEEDHYSFGALPHMINLYIPEVHYTKPEKSGFLIIRSSLIFRQIGVSNSY